MRVHTHTRTRGGATTGGHGERTAVCTPRREASADPACPHLDLGLLASATVSEKCTVYAPGSAGLGHRGPSRVRDATVLGAWSKRRLRNTEPVRLSAAAGREDRGGEARHCPGPTAPPSSDPHSVKEETPLSLDVIRLSSLSMPVLTCSPGSRSGRRCPASTPHRKRPTDHR